ncbi:hypothetical protein [Pseudomonas sp. MBLB4136]|uniref:hypothetical protein n=1 Tax=Pseudomonas sp. MBLB4136 TaxID=3451558 RepID=UPI003F750A36
MKSWLLVVCALLAGCAGYRYGEVSHAYLEPAPAVATVVRGRQNWLEVPGARVRVELGNEVQHSEHQVILFIVPVMYDPIDKPLYQAGRGARLLLEISPQAGAAGFRPEQVVLSIDGREHRPAGVQQLVAFDPGQYPLEGVRDAEERAPAGLDYPLQRAGRHYQFWLRFDAPMPAPSQDIRLDLSRALRVPGQPAVPPIRFRVVPWKQSYT